MLSLTHVARNDFVVYEGKNRQITPPVFLTPFRCYPYHFTTLIPASIIA